jgi:hypothetical protein
MVLPHPHCARGTGGGVGDDIEADWLVVVVSRGDVDDTKQQLFRGDALGVGVAEGGGRVVLRGGEGVGVGEEDEGVRGGQGEEGVKESGELYVWRELIWMLDVGMGG